MALLKMDHVWIEVPDELKKCVDHLNLLQGLTQSWLAEGLEDYGLVQLRQMKCGSLVRKQEQDLCFSGESARQADRILSEIERKECHLHMCLPYASIDLQVPVHATRQQ